MKILAQLMVAILVFFSGYFFYSGISRSVWEGDSLAYHLPIASLITEGNYLKKDMFVSPFYYYPAMGEVLLSGWSGLMLPMNLYNLAGWGFLIFLTYCFCRKSGLSKPEAIILSGGVALWPSVVRLINTQTVDIWVAVWWIAALLFFSNRKKLLWAGICLGLLMGTKYTGPIFGLVLIFAYWKDVRSFSFRENLKWLTPMILVGGFWYLRNWIITGNPVYPAHIPMLGWTGEPELTLFTGKPVLTIINTPGLFLEALFSEYLGWGLVLLLPLVRRNRMVFLGFTNFLLYLMLPSRPENVISDLRYIYPAMIPLAIEGWRWATTKIVRTHVAMLVLLFSIMEVTQLDYHPKVFLLIASIVFMGAIGYERYKDQKYSI